MLGRFAVPEFLNGTDRLSTPHMRVGQRLRQIPWEQALETAAGKLKEFAGDGFVLVCDTTSTLEDRHIFKKFTNEVMKSTNYIEIEPDAHGVSRGSLPAGAKAALLTGNFLDLAALKELGLLIVQDCYPTPVSERADVVLPAAVFAEVEGTILDRSGRKRPLRKACEPPGQAKPEWWIICRLAQAMGAEGFEYESAEAISKELRISNAHLSVERPEAPPAATDFRLRRTYFRGHRIDEKVRGLRELPVEDPCVLEPAQDKHEGAFEILEKHEIAPNVHEIIIQAPEVAKKALPGQFVIVMVDPGNSLLSWSMKNPSACPIRCAAGILRRVP
ncbi:MAG: molybdopterin-dependent oxidoreductase [Planctomycetota bacterium]